jgi:serine/threonine protein kinase
MDYRDYLEEHRDPRHLCKILMMVLEGLQELHELGYVHRDLKPENIALTLRPLNVAVIDFDRATPRTELT